MAARVRFSDGALYLHMPDLSYMSKTQVCNPDLKSGRQRSGPC